MRYTMILLALLVAACGGDSNPVAPSATPPPATISGNWSGTFTFTPVTGGQRIVEAVTASFTQASGNVTGEVRHGNGGNTLVSGVVTSSTLTASVQFTGVTGCVGTASVSGSATATQLRFTIPTLASSQCNFFTNGEFVLNR